MRGLLLLVGAIVFVDTMFFAALTPLLPQYAEELGLSKAGAGLLAASYALGALVGGIPGGMSSHALRSAGDRPRRSHRHGDHDRHVRLRRLDLAARHRTLSAGSREFVLLDGFAGVARRGRAGRATWRDDRRRDGCRDRPGALPDRCSAGSHRWWAPGRRSRASRCSRSASLPGGPTPRTPEHPQPLRRLFGALRDRAIVASIWFVLVPALFGALNVLDFLRLDVLGLSALAIGATWLVAASFEAALSPT